MKYPNIKVTVVCLPNVEKDIKKVFFEILDDYTKRFNVKVTDKAIKVHVCLVDYPEESSSAGLTSYAEDENKILIQMRDPWLSNWEDNPYMVQKFCEILCHEFVHACQNLTGRKGFKVKGMIVDKENSLEPYWFDPEEMEARMLEMPYAMLYAQKIL